jgi:hypothetical protein
MFGFRKDSKTSARDAAREQQRESSRLDHSLCEKTKLLRLLEAELTRHARANNVHEGRRTSTRIASVKQDIAAIEAEMANHAQMLRLTETASRTAASMASAQRASVSLARVATAVQPVKVMQMQQRIERSKEQIEMANEALADVFQADDQDMIDAGAETPADAIFKQAFETAMPVVPAAPPSSSEFPPSMFPAVPVYDLLQSRLDALRDGDPKK